MSKSIVIVGAGGTMGLALAQKFGQEGFDVGLIARKQENLDTLAKQLADAGVAKVKTATADVTKPAELGAALDSLKAELGSIDVLEYSPSWGASNYRPVLDVTVESVRSAFDIVVGGAIASVNHVLPAMLEKGEGAILFSAGGSAMRPIPPLANVGVAMAGLRNYVQNLQAAVAPKGVYVGAMYVGGMIKRGTPVDPDEIAAKLFNMYSTRDKNEDVVVPPMPPGGPGGPGGPPPGGPPPA